MNLLRQILLMQAVDFKNKGIELSNIHKKIIDESSIEEIAETEIILINAEYLLKEIEEKK